MYVLRPIAALPERFNWVESMLFSPEPDDAQRMAERYVGNLLARPVAPPRVIARLPDLPLPVSASRG